MRPRSKCFEQGRIQRYVTPLHPFCPALPSPPGKSRSAISLERNTQLACSPLFPTDLPLPQTFANIVPKPKQFRMFLTENTQRVRVLCSFLRKCHTRVWLPTKTFLGLCQCVWTRSGGVTGTTSVLPIRVSTAPYSHDPERTFSGGNLPLISLLPSVVEFSNSIVPENEGGCTVQGERCMFH